MCLTNATVIVTALVGLLVMDKAKIVTSMQRLVLLAALGFLVFVTSGILMWTFVSQFKGTMKKRVAAPYRGAWDSRKLSKFANPATKYEGLGGFLGEPKVEQREPWDGMDGVVEEEEFSLEDLMGDDEL